jgi:5-methylcytosine-specific restriction endonuclease McrA
MWFLNKSKYYREAFRSNKWPQVRNNHIKINNKCAACGSVTRLEAHHIQPVHLFPEKELDPENLITLCDKNCHFIFGHLMNWKSWNKDIINDAKEFCYKVDTRP